MSRLHCPLKTFLVLLSIALAAARISAEEPPSFRLEFSSVGDPFPAPEGTPFAANGACYIYPPEGIAPELGAVAWSLSFAANGMAITDVTVHYTRAADVNDSPPGLRDQGFERSELTTDGEGECEGRPGAVSIVSLSNANTVTLPVDWNQTILRYRLEGTFPAPGEVTPVRIDYVDGCLGTEGAVTNQVANRDGAVTLEKISREFSLRGIPACPQEDAPLQVILQGSNVGQTAEFAAGILPTPDPLKPAELTVSPGSVDVFAAIVSNLTEEPPRGVQGWSLSVGVSGDIHLADATTAGTVAAKASRGPPGLRSESSFENTMAIDPDLGYMGRLEPQGQGAVTAVVLTFVAPFVTLDPVGTATVLRMEIEGEEGDEGLISFRYGLRGHGGPVSNNATVNGSTRDFSCWQHAKVLFTTPEAVFHRGDVNDDGKIDLGDPVRLLENLFLGATRPLCRDAADFNDDGRVDISDVVSPLNFLFLGGPPPAAPGPPSEPCGKDPLPHTDDGCREYRSC